MWLRTPLDSLKSGRCQTPGQQARRSESRRRPAACRLWLEALEDRRTPAAVLSIWDATALEGNVGTQNAAVTVTLSEPHSNAVSVNYRTADGTALAGSDYNAVSGKLNFAKNEMTKTILVPIRGDRVVDPGEYFFVRLDSSKAGAKITNGQAVVTIVDNQPLISINDVSVREGTAGATPMTFIVSLSQAYDLPVTVNYATADGSATAGIDYVAKSDTLVFAPGQTSKTIEVQVNGDRIPEPDQNFYINLSTPDSYAAISRAVGVGTIVDAEPRISINDVSALEGNSGTTAFTFTVSLSAAYDLPVTVNYATADGTAAAGSDYASVSGTLTFQPGQPTSQTITVLVNGDRLFEENETFFVNLSTPNSYAEITKAVGVGTIIDNEPRISVGDAYNYGDYSPFTFTVSLSAASDEVVTVDFTTVDGTALAGVDYVFTSGTLRFEPGVTSMTITVDILDPTYADNKYFTVHLSNASTNALIGNEGATGFWSYYYDPGYGYYDPYYYGWY